MKLKKFHSILEGTPENVREHVKISMDILDRINYLLDKKFDGKQRLLADKMGKSEAEVSKWLNGVQNFTTKTLTKLSIAFGEPVIAVCTYSDDEDSTFVQVKNYDKSSSVTWIVDKKGNLDGRYSEYKEILSSNLNINKKNKSDLPA